MGKKKIGKLTYPDGSQFQRIAAAFQALSLNASASSFELLAKETQNANGTIFDFLEDMLKLEFSQKEDDRINLRLKQAKLQPIKTIEEFDFSYQPSIDAVQIHELASGRFIESGKNVVFLGPPGVGKTHLATALGYKAIQHGYTVRCMRLNEFIGAVNRTSKSSLSRLVRLLVIPDLLILDDIDYYDTDQETGRQLFNVLKQRCESQASTIVTSNKNPIEWVKQFGADEHRGKALLDRIMSREVVEVINIKGDSYRVPRANILTNPEEVSQTLKTNKHGVTDRFRSILPHGKSSK